MAEVARLSNCVFWYLIWCSKPAPTPNTIFCLLPFPCTWIAHTWDTFCLRNHLIVFLLFRGHRTCDFLLYNGKKGQNLPYSPLLDGFIVMSIPSVQSIDVGKGVPWWLSLGFFQLNLFPSAEKVVSLQGHAYLEPVSLLDPILLSRTPELVDPMSGNPLPWPVRASFFIHWRAQCTAGILAPGPGWMAMGICGLWISCRQKHRLRVIPSLLHEWLLLPVVFSLEPFVWLGSYSEFY